MNIWKEYSKSYIKNNKTAGISILAAAFITALFLSLICGVFYNIWTDNIRLIESKEGAWQGRLSGNLTTEDLKLLKCHSNVKKVIVEDLETSQGLTASISFYHPERIYKDLPQLAKQLTKKDVRTAPVITYHNKLLELYFIYSPENKYQPPLIMLVYIFILVTACLSLVLIIHNAFGVSMNARLHQLGILKSIGAAPRQLRTALIHEAFSICLPSILAGILAGSGLCYIFMYFMNRVVISIREYELQFYYPPLIFFVAFCASFVTVSISAGIPARKISRLSPLEAVRYDGELPVMKMKRFYLLSHLFGLEGELARKSLYQRRKAFKTASLSITLSLLVFSSFLNLETISYISTKYTFFERYKDKWDLLATVENTGKNQTSLLSDIKNLPGIKRCISYQKTDTYTSIAKDMQSVSLLSIGGLKDTSQLKAPVLVLDEVSFKQYCQETGTDYSLFHSLNKPGAIVVNTIWDNKNSNRRYKEMIPFLDTAKINTLDIWMDRSTENSKADNSKEYDRSGKNRLTVEIIAITDKYPGLREEFPNFSLLLVMPERLFSKTAVDFSSSKHYYSITADSDGTISKLENNLKNLLEGKYNYTLDNRLTKEKYNHSVRNAYKIVIASLAGLLALIGLANVFSNTMGQIYQRKREFARYISLGLTPKGVIKILSMEALILGFIPLFTSLLLNIPIVLFALKKSLISPQEFLQQIPAVPIGLFTLVILFGIALAYFTGGRKLYSSELISILKQDTIL